MRTLIAALLIGSPCFAFGSKKPSPNPVSTPSSPSPILSDKTLEELSAQIYPVKGWDAGYSQAIKILQAQSPVDSPCKDVEVFLKGIVSAESGFDRTQVFQEPAPLNQKSIGLFQLSLTDNSYGCGFANEADIKNPIKNIACAYKIFAKLKKSNPSENIWQYGGRYWSSLRWNKFGKWAGKRQAGVNEVLSYVRNHGCSL